MKNPYCLLASFFVLFNSCKPLQEPANPFRNTSVFVTSYNGSLYALDAETGLEQWNTILGTPMYANPSVNGETVYGVGKSYTRNVTLYALNRKTGAVKWTAKNELPVNLLEPFFTTPTITGQTAIVINGRESDGHGDALVVALDAGTGQKRWAHPAALSSDFTVSDGVVYLANSSIQAISVQTGSVLWTFTPPATGFVNERPAIADGIIYAVSRNGRLYAIDSNVQQTKWLFRTNDSPVGPAIVSSGLVYISSSGGTLYALDALTGVQKWSFKTTFLRRGPVEASGIVYISCASGDVCAIDAKTGVQRWLFKAPGDLTPNENQASPIIANGIAYFVSGSSRLYALNARTGEQQWSYQTDSKLLSSLCVVDDYGTGFNPLLW